MSSANSHSFYPRYFVQMNKIHEVCSHNSSVYRKVDELSPFVLMTQRLLLTTRRLTDQSKVKRMKQIFRQNFPKIQPDRKLPHVYYMHIYSNNYS